MAQTRLVGLLVARSPGALLGEQRRVLGRPLLYWPRGGELPVRGDPAVGPPAPPFTMTRLGPWRSQMPPPDAAMPWPYR
ncbi:hypothetical protein ACTWPT_58125 [Nonomuraea sp. 3N208]|uniref:hypothetical protein n=1 Tax=Nonomuraea sp. 3N208 TaxID=3457421 RepID=UPI003FCFCF7F